MPTTHSDQLPSISAALIKNKARSRALVHSKANVIALARKLRALSDTGQISTYTEFLREQCRIADVELRSSAKSFSRNLHEFLNNPAKHIEFFAPKDYERIVVALFENKLWYPMRGRSHELFPDLAFHAVARFIGMDRNRDDGSTHTEDTRDLAKHFTGEYNIYRHDNYDPGKVLSGNLIIAYDPDTRAVITDEHYFIPNVKKHVDLEGFLFGYDRRYRLLSRHPESRNPQVIYIHRVTRTEKHDVRHMDGIAVDIEHEQGRLYVTRVVCVRIDEDNPKVEARSLELKEIKSKVVKQKLTEKPTKFGPHVLTF